MCTVYCVQVCDVRNFRIVSTIGASVCLCIIYSLGTNIQYKIGHSSVYPRIFFLLNKNKNDIIEDVHRITTKKLCSYISSRSK